MKFNLVPQKDPSNRERNSKLYASPCSERKISGDELEKLISSHSSASRGDVKGVLADIAEIIPQYLSEGYSIELSGIGILKLSFSSIGVESPAQFNTSLIGKSHVRFRALSRLVQDINEQITYEYIKGNDSKRKEL